MNYIYGKKIIINESKNIFSKLSLTEEGKIIIEKYEKNIKVSKDLLNIPSKVLTFSGFAYEKEILIAYICNNNKLIVSRLDDKLLEDLISINININSNRFNTLCLKVQDGIIHIFYNYCNLINSDVWTIKHIVCHKGIKKHNIISYIPLKDNPTFTVDLDSLGNIHLVYENKEEQLHQLYYLQFSSLLGKWRKYPKDISDKHNSPLNYYIFIDSKDILHVIWNLKYNNTVIYYKILSNNTNNRYNWVDISLPQNNDNKIHPIFFQHQNHLKIIYIDNNKKIKGFFSKDFGLSWNIYDFQSSEKYNDLVPIAFASKDSTSNTHINHIYYSDNNIVLPTIYALNNNNSKIETNSLNMDDHHQESTSTKNNKDILDAIKQFEESKKDIIKSIDDIKNNLDENHEILIKKMESINDNIINLKNNLDNKSQKGFINKIINLFK
ncbi:hypothetical protein [Clostridiisalibacter paucivorans]|uniref:hypothetical protein n=1 Tax=Clostridiisalibacter paucivorans TaxID=408753 RepID=UPI000478A52C|nr:hypothetical protein [Clostridiisalibacter paucivorans]